ncbi:MAG: carbon-nitrogen hydrolase family protein [Chitinophagales bacterium]
MRVGAAQMYISNDIKINEAMILKMIIEAAEREVELVAFPEMSLTGFYLPTLTGYDYQDDLARALDRITLQAEKLGMGIIIGRPSSENGQVFNSASIILPGGINYRYDKNNLIAEEEKYFSPGNRSLNFTYKDHSFGVIICRDQNYPDLAREACQGNASALFILAAHFYPPAEARKKLDKNVALPIARAVENKCHVVFTNTVGSNMGLNSLGNSMIVHPEGVIIAKADESSVVLLTCDIW